MRGGLVSKMKEGTPATETFPYYYSSGVVECVNDTGEGLQTTRQAGREHMHDERADNEIKPNKMSTVIRRVQTPVKLVGDPARF